MAQPDVDIDIETSRAKALVDNARRLGLTWDLIPATITMDGNPSLQGILDGDSAPIGLVSMIGTCEINDRVQVMRVPPAGNFIVGWAVDVPRLRARASYTLVGAGYTSINTWAADENIGRWAVASSTTFTVPQSGYYTICCTCLSNTVAIANSVQAISLNPVTTVQSWGSAAVYRDFWSVNENVGTVTAQIPFNKGDTFSFAVRQNSAASQIFSLYMTAMRNV